MTRVPRSVASALMLILLAAIVPIAAFAQGNQYTGGVVRTLPNCGLTQVLGTVLDGSGNPQNGVHIRLWWADQVLHDVSGEYPPRPDLGIAGAGWDFSLDTKPVANTWYVAVENNDNTALLSDPVQVVTSGGCNATDSNVVQVTFRQGAAPAAPTPTQPPAGPAQPPAQPTQPPAQPPSGGHTFVTEPAPPIAAGATCRFYTETNAGQGGGYSVCDDTNARFLTAFNRYGLQNVGYPVSQRFKRDGFITQAFQKAIYQWRPDGNYVAFVNTFDELSQAGFDQTLLERRQTPGMLPGNWEGDNVPFQQSVQRRQALLNPRPALRTTYFSVADPLLFFGLPVSEIKDMGNHYAIRLQRAVLQEWKENVPWARAGQVTIANGGDIAKELGHLPSFALTTEASAPGGGGAPAPAPAPTTGFGYGIQAHMIYVDRGPVYRATRDLGFNWLKQQIEWKVWEPVQGQVNWGEMDAIVNEANANGIQMLFSAVGAPAWAREAGHDASVAGPPQDPQTFANFLGAMAGRYCGKGLGAIEVWNEQNLHYEWGNRPISPAAYMNLLRPSYTAIKAACPSMIVVSGALTPTGAPAPLAMDDFEYLRGMYANGLRNFADAIGAHPSGYNVPPNLDHTQACNYIRQTNSSFTGPCDVVHHSWSFRSTVDGYRAIMTANNDSAKKIWATEFGWATQPAYHPDYRYANDNTRQEQAEWTVQAYQYMKNSGFVGAAFLWNLNFRVVADGTEKAQWGIVENNWQPLPAYSALKAMPK